MRIRRKLRKEPQEVVNQQESDHESKSSKALNVTALKDEFAKCSDVQFSQLMFNNHQVTFIYCSGLVNMDLLYNSVPEKLEKLLGNYEGVLEIGTVLESLNLPTLSFIDNIEDATSDVFSGKLLMDLGVSNTFFTVEISERPQRQPEDTKAESTVLGPRDDFIEDINVNFSLIRKRLKTTSLVFDEFLLGKRTKTKILLVYMDDIVNRDTLRQIRDKLSSISVDSVLSGTQLEELMADRPYSFFPKHKYTGKPDFAVQTILSGRFVILIDGVATAYITPVNFHLLFKSFEDRELNYLYSSFGRVLRISGLLASTLLPGAWIAFTTYHQEQLPLTLLATVVESRRGIPFPTALEAFAMLILFDLFREAGIRLPMAIGQILSVVGGLIIGDAAIRSGLTSPSMLVVIALSTVSTFTLVDQSLIGTLSIMRLFSVFMSSLFGFVGLLLSFYLFLSYLGTLQVFGVPYLDGVNKFDLGYLLKTFFRLPDPAMKSRPGDLDLNDETRRDG